MYEITCVICYEAATQCPRKSSCKIWILTLTLLNGKLCRKECQGSSFNQTMSCMRLASGQNIRGLSWLEQCHTLPQE